MLDDMHTLKQDWQEMIDSTDKKAYSCHRHDCEWSGKLVDMDRKYVNSEQSAWLALAGREGYEYFCPLCGTMLASRYDRMS